MDLRSFNQYQNIEFDLEKEINDIKFINIGLTISHDNTLIIIDQLLTENECNDILSKSTDQYQTLKHEFLEKDRQSERFLNINDNMANIIYHRISKIVHMENNQKSLTPYGFGIEGIWSPIGINPCFRHSKYVSPSNGFTFHRDTCYVHDRYHRSIFTLIIYLNDEFEGGETIFVQPKTDRIIGEIVSEELKNGYTELYTFQPKKGSALLFNHNVIHCGQPVISGVKHIIRTDVIFENTTPELSQDYETSKYFIQAVEYYREANNQEMLGNVTLSSELYERGLSLRQFH